VQGRFADCSTATLHKLDETGSRSCSSSVISHGYTKDCCQRMCRHLISTCTTGRQWYTASCMLCLMACEAVAAHLGLAVVFLT
jgi:hypothetical protein